MRGVRQWRHVTVRHGAFCVSRQHRLCRWWPAHFMYYSWKAHVIIHLWHNHTQSVNHEQFPIQMTQNKKQASGSLHSWQYCVGARFKFWRRSRVPKKGNRDEAVFLAASPLVTAPPSNFTRLYYNGSAAKSHLTTTQYRQLRRLASGWNPPFSTENPMDNAD